MISDFWGILTSILFRKLMLLTATNALRTTSLSAKQTCRSWCCVFVSQSVSQSVSINVESKMLTTGWQDDRVTKWPSDRVTKWPSDQVTKWPSDQVTGSFADDWPYGIFYIILPSYLWEHSVPCSSCWNKTW